MTTLLAQYAKMPLLAYIKLSKGMIVGYDSLRFGQRWIHSFYETYGRDDMIEDLAQRIHHETDDAVAVLYIVKYAAIRMSNEDFLAFVSLKA